MTDDPDQFEKEFERLKIGQMKFVRENEAIKSKIINLAEEAAKKGII